MTTIITEQAENEFDSFVEKMDLDLNTDHMDAEDFTQFQKQKRRIVQAIENGHLIINDDGEPIYTPHRTEGYTDAIHFYEPTGAVIMMMDKKKAGQDVAKMHAIIGAMTKQNAVVFSKLTGSDYKICTAIAALFLD